MRPAGGPTYMPRTAGAPCWQRLGREDDLTLLNVGARFPENGKIGYSSNSDQRSDPDARHLIIETVDGFWGYLASPVVPRQTHYKSFLTVTFNPASQRLGFRELGQADVTDPNTGRRLCYAHLAKR